MPATEIARTVPGWPQVLIGCALACTGGLMLLTLFTSQMASSLSSIRAMLDGEQGRDD